MEFIIRHSCLLRKKGLDSLYEERSDIDNLVNQGNIPKQGTHLFSSPHDGYNCRRLWVIKDLFRISVTHKATIRTVVPVADACAGHLLLRRKLTPRAAVAARGIWSVLPAGREKHSTRRWDWSTSAGLPMPRFFTCNASRKPLATTMPTRAASHGVV